MKFLNLSLAIVAVSSLVGSAASKGGAPVAKPLQPLNDDFVVGFETGIFLRKDSDAMEEYKCPAAEIKIAEFQKVKKMWPSVSQIIVTMNDKDEELNNMMESLNIFITHIDELVGVFENDYNGGDFCAGLKFGYNGSNLLSSIAETIVTHHISKMSKDS